MQCSTFSTQRHVCASAPRTNRVVSTAQPCFSNIKLSANALPKLPYACRAKAQRLTCKAVAQGDTAESATSADPGVWYAVVANAEFMLHDVQNESFAEQLREKTRHYKELGREVDFFLVSNPAWLDEKFPQEGKQVRRPCVAMVSKDKYWTLFMKLRLDRVMMLTLGPMDDQEVLKSTGPVPEFKKFENWTAPYSPYAPGWWEPFMKSSN